MEKLVNLTNHFEVTSGAHVLYFFDNDIDYLNNLLAYIKIGIERKEQVIVIEHSNIQEVLENNGLNRFTEDGKQFIQFVDQRELYLHCRELSAKNVIEFFGNKLKPIVEKGTTIRIWSNVTWKEETDSIYEKVGHFEEQFDRYIEGLGVLTVCAYSASKISAQFQTKLMKSHKYLMTDKELVQSSFYQSSED